MDMRSLGSVMAPKSTIAPEPTSPTPSLRASHRQHSDMSDHSGVAPNGAQLSDTTNQPSTSRQNSSLPPSMSHGSTSRTVSEAVTFNDENGNPTIFGSGHRQHSFGMTPLSVIRSSGTESKQPFPNFIDPPAASAQRPADFPGNEAHAVDPDAITIAPSPTQSLKEGLDTSNPNPTAAVTDVPRNQSTMSNKLFHPGDRRRSLEPGYKKPSAGPSTPIPVDPVESAVPSTAEPPQYSPSIAWSAQRHPRNVTPPPRRKGDVVKAKLKKCAHAVAGAPKKLWYKWERFYTLLHEPGWVGRKMEGNAFVYS